MLFFVCFKFDSLYCNVISFNAFTDKPLAAVLAISVSFVSALVLYCVNELRLNCVCNATAVYIIYVHACKCVVLFIFLCL